MDATASFKNDAEFSNLCSFYVKIENAFPFGDKQKKSVIKYTRLPEFDFSTIGNCFVFLSICLRYDSKMAIINFMAECNVYFGTIKFACLLLNMQTVTVELFSIFPSLISMLVVTYDKYKIFL